VLQGYAGVEQSVQLNVLGNDRNCEGFRTPCA
jgi:hypothetical protein